MPEPHVTTYEGQPGRECGEHRPTIDRAWCFDCSEWCYPNAPCARCELPMVRAELERLRAELDAGEFQWGWLSADQVRVYQSPSEQDARRAAGRSGARRLMRRRRGPWVDVTDDVPGEVPDASS